MSFLTTIIETSIRVLPFLGTVIAVAVLLWGADRILIRRHPELGNERLFSRQLVMLGLTLAGVVAIALALPVSENTRIQIIGLIGLVISGVIAFSSSTIFSNIMAGMMLRVTKPFQTGDFIDVGDHFGRVVERGLMDTEIQTENRDLVALPNMFMITHPVSVVQSSGAIISTILSLGYDIHHSGVEPLLLEAAKECGLEEPFVQILEIGNYSVSYKISGLLTDVKTLLTVRSNLRKEVLDALHGNQIEIMSPTFMNQRKLPDGVKIIPPLPDLKPTENVTVAEDIAFDKADQAEQIEVEKQRLLAIIQASQKALEDDPEVEKESIQEIIRETREKLKLIDGSVAESDPDKRVTETK